MSKDKYTSIFLRKIEAVVIIILQRFCNAREKMFTNSLLFAELDVFFFSCIREHLKVFSDTT